MSLITCLLSGLYPNHSASWSPLFNYKDENNYYAILQLRDHSENQDEDLVCSWLSKHTSLHSCTIAMKFTIHDWNELPSIKYIIQLYEVEPKEVWMQTNTQEDLKWILNWKPMTLILNGEIIGIQKTNNNNDRICDPIKEAKVKHKAIHVIESQGFYIAPSQIPNAGYGLYTLWPRPRGSTLLTFQGTKYPEKEFQSHPISCEYSVTGEDYKGEKYVFDPTEHHQWSLNIAKKTSNWGPFINEPSQNGFCNAESISVSNPKIPLRVDIVTTRDIQPNNEIYMLYNRVSDTYSIGFACPSPMFQKQIVKNNNNHHNSIICIGMTQTKNSDVARIQLLKSKYQKVITISEDFLDTACVFSDVVHIQITDWNKLDHIILQCIQKHVLRNVDIYLDYHVIKPSEAILKYINELWIPHQNSLIMIPNAKPMINTSLYIPWNLDDYYAKKNLVSTPYIIQTLKTKENFIDVFEDQDIISHSSISDIDTVSWLKKYCSSIKKINMLLIPLTKPKTKLFIESQTWLSSFEEQ